MLALGMNLPELYLDGAEGELQKGRQVSPLARSYSASGGTFGDFHRALTASAANRTLKTLVGGSNTGLHSAVGSGSGVGSSGRYSGSLDTARTRGTQNLEEGWRWWCR